MRSFDEICRDLQSRRVSYAQIEDWLPESIEPVESGRVGTGEVYANYVAWAKVRGLIPFAHRAISNALVRAGAQRHRNGLGRWWIGFRLKPTGKV